MDPFLIITHRQLDFITIELYSNFFKKHLQLKIKFILLLPNFDFNDKFCTNS